MNDEEKPNSSGSVIATGCIVIAIIGVIVLIAFTIMAGNIMQQLTMGS